jgi:hypothetical protein
MPRFNGTGPEGRGSRTGRGAGLCKPAVVNNNTAKETVVETSNEPITNLDNNFRGPNFNRSMGNFNRGQGRGLNVGRGRGCGFNGRGNRGNFNN